jgi:hypothetical protein
VTDSNEHASLLRSVIKYVRMKSYSTCPRRYPINTFQSKFTYPKLGHFMANKNMLLISKRSSLQKDQVHIFQNFYIGVVMTLIHTVGKNGRA